MYNIFLNSLVYAGSCMTVRGKTETITPSWVSKILKAQGFINIKNEILIPGMTKIVWGVKT